MLTRIVGVPEIDAPSKVEERKLDKGVKGSLPYITANRRRDQKNAQAIDFWESKIIPVEKRGPESINFLQRVYLCTSKVPKKNFSKASVLSPTLPA